MSNLPKHEPGQHTWSPYNENGNEENQIFHSDWVQVQDKSDWVRVAKRKQ